MSLQDLLDVVPSGSEERSLLRAIDFDRLPRHVAIIMDGNGRWAKLRHKRRVEGHRAGIASVRDVVETSARLGLQVLTLYAFSVENWKRPQTEVSTLMELLKRYLRMELQTLLRNNIRFQVIGRMGELPPDVQEELQRGIERTRERTGLLFNIALNYGGRAEITDAVRALVAEAARSGRDPSTIGEHDLARHLYTAGQPDPGLLAARGVVALRATGAVLTALCFADALRPLAGMAVVPAAALIALGAMLFRAGDPPGALSSAAGTLLAAAYLGGLGGTLAGLRLAPAALGGPWVMMLLLTTVMSADSAALFAGSAVGRHKMAPRISPAKTWEGFVGGLVGGIAGALVIRQLGLRWMPLLHAVLLAVATAAAGTAGDLVESLLKRWAGVKDSGRLFPGHGGMLDRLDSLLFGAPVLYYYLLYAR